MLSVQVGQHLNFNRRLRKKWTKFVWNEARVSKIRLHQPAHRMLISQMAKESFHVLFNSVLNAHGSEIEHSCNELSHRLSHPAAVTTSTVQPGSTNLLCLTAHCAHTPSISRMRLNANHGDETNNLIASQNDRLFWKRTNPTWHICRYYNKQYLFNILSYTFHKMTQGASISSRWQKPKRRNTKTPFSAASGIFHSSSRISAANLGQVPSHKLKASRNPGANLSGFPWFLFILAAGPKLGF